jgi:hypothetical protein
MKKENGRLLFSKDGRTIHVMACDLNKTTPAIAIIANW